MVNQRKTKSFLLIAFVGFLLSACKEPQTELPVSIGSEYQPLLSGAEYIYSVDSVVYDDFNQRIDSFQYKVKERFVRDSQLIDSAFVLQLYGENATGSWQLKKRWTAAKNNQFFVRTEENVPKQILSFPVREFVEFNENNFNSLQEKTVEYKAIAEPFSLAAASYQETLTTEFNYFDTVLTRYNERRIFAKNIGLVYHYFEYIDLQKDSGLVYEKQLVSYTLP